MNFHTLRTFYMSFVGAIIADVIFVNILIRELRTVNFKNFDFKSNKIMVTVYIILLIIAIDTFYSVIIPSIKDLSYVLNGEYETVTGESLKSFGARTKGAHPGVEIKDEKTGEVITINLYYQPRINRGDRLTVNYLPNTKIGNVAGQGYFRRNK